MLGYVAQAKELTELRAQYDWIAAVSQTAQQQALRDLDQAFSNFFEGKAKFPTPRKKGENDTFRFQGRDIEIRAINNKWSDVWLPKIGWVRFRDTRPIRGTIKNVTISHCPLGWHVTFSCEFSHEPIGATLPHLGIDRGIANTLAFSTGELMSVPSGLNVIDRRLRNAQKTLSRRKKGSNRRRKAKERCAALSAKRSRIRQDWHHKISSDISARFSVVVLEDLNIRNMSAAASGSNVKAKAGLNRNILNQGWGQFATFLSYKLEERAGTLVLVNPAYTSQSCSECGTIDSESRKSQADFDCQHCGFRGHADTNAAINILRRNTASMGVEEGHLFSCEALTGSGKPAENHAALAA